MRFLIEIAHVGAAAAQRGVRVVEEYPSFALVESPVMPANLPAGACEAFAATAISVHGLSVEIPEGEFVLDAAPHALVRFIGPLAPRWRQTLEDAGIEVLFWAPPNGACVRLAHPTSVADFRTSFPFIAGAQPYAESQCARRVAPPSAAVRRETGALPSTWDLVCFSRALRGDVEAELRGRGIELLASSSSKIRVRFAGDPAVLRDIVGVKLVGAARAPKLASTTALAQSLDLPLAGDAWPTRYDGRGQVIAVADTGLDRGSRDANSLHADFSGRVRELASWAINSSWDGFVDNPGHDDGGADIATGHGTYIAGLVLASGAQSQGTHRGLAPAAELVFQALEQRSDIKPQFRSQIPSGYHLSGRPLDLRQMFRQARDLGARIHVNAWGDPANGHYTDDCFETDLFLHENPDAVILFAAGNDATDRDGNRVLDAGSLFAPASSKNAIAVGATEGPLQGAGWRGTWAQIDPSGARFRASADRADPISGEPNRIALFSCTGPTEDGRIKPDICAPGTNVVGPRSQATAAQGWGLASPLPYYMYDGGTSAATGVAGGFVALLRQAWTEARGGSAPSGAALKALAILGAQPVRSRRDGLEEPRFVAGFGLLDFGRSLPQRADGSVRLIDEQAPGLQTGDAREFAFVQPSTGPFRAVLAWYDAPGERLVNDLDLSLVGPGGVVAWGNHPSGSTGSPDRVNTVERIDVAVLDAGSYVLRVVARNIFEGPQPFALAVASPRPSFPDVPVDWLNGVGSRISAQFAQNGIVSVRELRGRTRAEIETLARVRGAASAKLEANLALVFRTLDLGLDTAIPRDLPLSRLANATPPAQVAVSTWLTARSSLLPLLPVFDKTRLVVLTLDRLFV